MRVCFLVAVAALALGGCDSKGDQSSIENPENLRPLDKNEFIDKIIKYRKEYKDGKINGKNEIYLQKIITDRNDYTKQLSPNFNGWSVVLSHIIALSSDGATVEFIITPVSDSDAKSELFNNEIAFYKGTIWVQDYFDKNNEFYNIVGNSNIGDKFKISGIFNKDEGGVFKYMSSDSYSINNPRFHVSINKIEKN